MADEVVFMDFWQSPLGMRVRTALVEKGITYYEYKEKGSKKQKSFTLTGELGPQENSDSHPQW